ARRDGQGRRPAFALRLRRSAGRSPARVLLGLAQRIDHRGADHPRPGGDGPGRHARRRDLGRGGGRRSRRTSARRPGVPRPGIRASDRSCDPRGGPARVEDRPGGFERLERGRELDPAGTRRQRPLSVRDHRHRAQALS
ncbi:MAG: hypothetical protein MZV63_59030, partial [Marinilabiliales bacterium]|nr:hypothetical protein [Marinilabiliales bacterium]